VLGLVPLHHNLGGPEGLEGQAIGGNLCGGYVYYSSAKGYLLCVLANGRKADTPPEIVPCLRFGAYLLCELGTSLEEVRIELEGLGRRDIQEMAKAALGPWLTWV
jgi:hypothetical protein